MFAYFNYIKLHCLGILKVTYIYKLNNFCYAYHMKALLQATDLTKDFGDNKGVFNVSLALNPGEIVGFVGPNGAGKSTTISMLCGNIYPDSGTITALEHSITPESIFQVMPDFGILLSEPTIELTITSRQLFTESEQLLGKTTNWHYLSDDLNLDIHKPIEKLSLGNKKKVGIILALMHQPQVVVMDEPTSGIDPIVVSKFSNLLKDVSARGGSVLLSSHDLNEIQDVCDRVVMIKAGKVIIDKPIESLLQEAVRKFTINSPPKDLKADLLTLFKNEVVKTASGVIIQTKEYKKLIDLLTSHKCYDFLIENPSLEEMFTEYYL